MAEAKEVTVTITDRLFTLELAIEDFELIDVILGAVKRYVKKGAPLRLKEACLDLDLLGQVISRQAPHRKE